MLFYIFPGWTDLHMANECDLFKRLFNSFANKVMHDFELQYICKKLNSDGVGFNLGAHILNLLKLAPLALEIFFLLSLIFNKTSLKR